ncbi:MAG: multidrug effflux MFS transporter [Flavipsychrobacter sp.]
MRSSDIRFAEFIFIIALLMAIVSLAINMILPAFQDITQTFHINDNKTHFTVSILYLGLGCSQLIYGPLSDSFGRKRVMTIGFAFFLFGCYISYITTSFSFLILGQLIQGVGMGAPRALNLAIVRDRFNGNKMAKAMSFIMVIYIFAPMIAPVLGKAIIAYYNWRAIYIAFFAISTFSILLFLYRMPETLDKGNRTKLNYINIKNALLYILSNKSSLVYIIILGMYSGIFISYLNLSQAIFEVKYSLGKSYPLVFATLATSIGIASLINGRAVVRLGMTNIVHYAITVSLILSVVYLLSLHYTHNYLDIFMLFMFLQLACYGFLISNLSTLAIQPLGHVAGMGASIIGALSTIISVPISILIGLCTHNTLPPLIIGFLGVSILSITILHYINKKQTIKTAYGKR